MVYFMETHNENMDDDWEYQKMSQLFSLISVRKPTTYPRFMSVFHHGIICKYICNNYHPRVPKCTSAVQEGGA